MMNRLEFDEPDRALPRAPLLCGQGQAPEVGPDKKCRCVVGSLVLALATWLTTGTGAAVGHTLVTRYGFAAGPMLNRP